MGTTAFKRTLAAGQTVVADMRACDPPFSWAAVLAAAGEIECRFSLSARNDANTIWLPHATNGTITETVADTEDHPLVWLRWRHVSGGAATIQIASACLVSWHGGS